MLPIIMSSNSSGNIAWVSRPFRVINGDLRRGARQGRGERLNQLLAEERDHSDDVVVVNNSSRVRAQIGNEEADHVIRSLTTPPSSLPSSPRSDFSSDGTPQSTLFPYGIFETPSSAPSSSALSSPAQSPSPPKKKRRTVTRTTNSIYIPYFKYEGKNTKGAEVFRCLLQPSLCGSSRSHHQKDIVCYSTSNLKQHLSAWHLPALTKIQEMYNEGIHSKGYIESRIFDLLVHLCQVSRVAKQGQF